MSAPALVGGTAIRAYDLPASSAFAAVYWLLVPCYAYRCIARQSRNWILYMTAVFPIERAVLYSLRAAAAVHPGFESSGLSAYMQLTFALGFPTLANTLIMLIRTTLVSTTNPPPESEEEAKVAAAAQRVADAHDQPFVLADLDPEDVRRRQFFRRCADGMGLIYLVLLALAIVAVGHLNPNADASFNHRNQILRYASDAIGLVLLLWEAGIMLWAGRSVPRIDQRAVRFLLLTSILLMVPAIYRLAVMLQTTPDLAAPTHAALNTQGDKAAFYILHVLPEWLVTYLLCAVNIKEVCSTGSKGDLRYRDETPAQREKRWAKARERERKKAMDRFKKRDGHERIEMTTNSRPDTDSFAPLV